MATVEYVSPKELEAAPKDMDKMWSSRLYTVKGELLLRIGQVQSSLETRMDGPESAVYELTVEIRNGHR